MKAPAADQLRLLDLQELDTALARVNHQLRVLPSAAKVEELQGAAQGLRGELASATSAQTDAKRALDKAEDDVAKVQERAAKQRERLDAGAGGPKELEAIQHELGQLATRQSELEDVALEALEAFEASQAKVAQIEGDIAQNEADLEKYRELASAEAAELSGQREDLATQRADLAGGIDADLLEEYEAARAATGGRGVVALRGVRAEGTELEFSAAELSRIRTAAPDDVLISEEHEVILVRLPE